MVDFFFSPRNSKVNLLLLLASLLGVPGLCEATSPPEEEQKPSEFCENLAAKDKRELSELQKHQMEQKKHASQCENLSFALDDQKEALLEFHKLRTGLCKYKNDSEKEGSSKVNPKLESALAKLDDKNASKDSCQALEDARKVGEAGKDNLKDYQASVKDGFKLIWRKLRTTSEATSTAISKLENANCTVNAQASHLAVAALLEKQPSTGLHQAKDEKLKKEFDSLFVSQKSYFGKILLSLKEEEKQGTSVAKTFAAQDKRLQDSIEKCKSLAKAYTKKDQQCREKGLKFSADYLPAVPPNGPDMVWGGNATGGGNVLNPPYAQDFLSRANKANENGSEVFAYLEGPCGNTGGRDDGEKARCRSLHRSYNSKYAPNTRDTDLDRWKPYTFAQLTQSGKYGIDHCEIDNLENNVTVPLIPLLKEIKRKYDNKEIHCRLVLKNLDAGTLRRIKSQVAPTPADADFISPFHIFEAGGTGQKKSLDNAMENLKGKGAKTIISTNTNQYGDYFTKDKFLSCSDKNSKEPKSLARNQRGK